MRTFKLELRQSGVVFKWSVTEEFESSCRECGAPEHGTSFLGSFLSWSGSEGAAVETQEGLTLFRIECHEVRSTERAIHFIGKPVQL
jgi:hypothetical protein